MSSGITKAVYHTRAEWSMRSRFCPNTLWNTLHHVQIFMGVFHWHGFWKVPGQNLCIYGTYLTKINAFKVLSWVKIALYLYGGLRVDNIWKSYPRHFLIVQDTLKCASLLPQAEHCASIPYLVKKERT